MIRFFTAQALSVLLHAELLDFGEGGADDAFRFGEQPENFDMISEDVCADRCSCLQLVCIYFIDCLLVFITF